MTDRADEEREVRARIMADYTAKLVPIEARLREELARLDVGDLEGRLKAEARYSETKAQLIEKRNAAFPSRER